MTGFIWARREAIDQIVKEKTTGGVDPVAAIDVANRMVAANPSYCQGDPMASMAMVIQFTQQLGFYVERPSGDIAYIASLLFVYKCLNMPKLATSKELPTIVATHDSTVTKLLDYVCVNAGTPVQLEKKMNRFVVGIVVGNRMAQEFFAQLHANTEPTPSSEIRQLFHEHVILRGRAMDDHNIHPIAQTDFVPDIRRWLTGDAPLPVTIAVVA
jgi:hypothetical protein